MATNLWTMAGFHGGNPNDGKTYLQTQIGRTHICQGLGKVYVHIKRKKEKKEKGK